jgi:hypothetical protein
MSKSTKRAAGFVEYWLSKRVGHAILSRLEALP